MILSKILCRGVDLQVLQINQTGLGEIKGDGVLSKLMRYFYENWLGGMEKHKAFTEAQCKIKEFNPNPYFWAGFIMLD